MCCLTDHRNTEQKTFRNFKYCLCVLHAVFYVYVTVYGTTLFSLYISPLLLCLCVQGGVRLEVSVPDLPPSHLSPSLHLLFPTTSTTTTAGTAGTTGTTSTTGTTTTAGKTVSVELVSDVGQSNIYHATSPGTYIRQYNHKTNIYTHVYLYM